MTVADMERLAALLGLTIVAWSLPEASWYPMCKLLVRVGRMVLRARRKASEVPPFLVELAGVTAERATIASSANLHRDTVEILRCHRPGGWNPQIELIGEDRLEMAIRGGKGVLIWVADFASASLIAKMALSQSSYKVSHLSRLDHGFSSSLFGVRFLNPIRTSVEDRYLQERVIMSRENRSQALRQIRRHLADGRVVSMTVLDDGAQAKTVSFFGTKIHLPTGPITLSRAAKAPLLPLFVQRSGPSAFKVIVETPISVSDGRDYQVPLEQYARLLEHYVESDPLGWLGWQR